MYFSVLVYAKMRYLGLLIICLLFTSCNYFNVKKTSSEEILNEELQSFNWNEVDEFPTFAACDSSSTLQERKKCFESTLTNHVINYLSMEKLVVSKDINDTVFIDFNLSEKGEIRIINIEANDELLSTIPKLSEFIEASLDSLPQIFPAIKRGQQVTTQFKLPIIVKAN